VPLEDVEVAEGRGVEDGRPEPQVRDIEDSVVVGIRIAR